MPPGPDGERVVRGKLAGDAAIVVHETLPGEGSPTGADIPVILIGVRDAETEAYAMGAFTLAEAARLAGDLRDAINGALAVMQ
jgi:hypothetical protein